MTTAAQILQYLDLPLIGTTALQFVEITGVAPLDRAKPTDMTFRDQAHLETPTKAGLALRRREFALAAWKFFPPPPSRITFTHPEGADIMRGAIVGGEPFASEQGIRMPSWAGVTLGRNVWIGHNTVVDRGMFEDTIIEDDTKIDNMVIVGHNAHIGKRCLITAGALIGGSSIIGDDTYIGIHATIRDHIKIGNRVTIGMGAVVLKDVPDGEVWVGNPARKLR